MPQSTPHAILVVNEHAEEVKLLTISLRGFFPDWRIDAAYSAEEAFAMTSVPDRRWDLLIIDETSILESTSEFLAQVKNRVPSAVILLQTIRTDSRSAIDALQAGVDYLLHKHSPAFLTELLFCAKEAFARPDRRPPADRSKDLHVPLIESFGDVAYQLDAEGRFLSVSHTILDLLNFEPSQLIGQPYHMIVSEKDRNTARFRFNERRSGERATTRLELTLQARQSQEGKVVLVPASISASGLYDSSNRFLGTAGIIRSLAERNKHLSTIQELHDRLHRAEKLRSTPEKLISLSKGIQDPLSRLVSQSQDLLTTLRETRVIERVESLVESATAASRMGEELGDIADETARTSQGFTINRVLEDLLSSAPAGQRPSEDVATDFADSLPSYGGNRETTVQLVQNLLDYARTYLAAVGRRRTLVIKTSAVGTPSSPQWPTLFPLASANVIDIEIFESDRVPPIEQPPFSAGKPVELLELYRCSRELGATLDVSASEAGPFHIRLRIPAEKHLPSEQPVISPQPPPSSPQSIVISAQAFPQTPTITGPLAAQERRSTPRLPTRLPAQVTLGSSTWDGTVMNIGQGGACVRLSNEFPPIQAQEAHVVVKAGAGILELSAFVYCRTDQSRVSTDDRRTVQLIIVFLSMHQTERSVLESLIEATLDQSLVFRVEVILETGRDISRAHEFDQRESIRVALSIPAKLESERYRTAFNRLTAQVLNISRGGACLHVKMHEEQIHGLIAVHFPASHRNFEQASHAPAAPDTVLTAHVVWTVRDQTAPGSLRAPGASYAMRIGVRFLALTPYSERELHRTISQYLSSQLASEPLTATVPVLTIPRECRNARGQTIVLTDNHVKPPVESELPAVIITPGFGQTAADYTAFAHYLAAHRFRVLRYDHTNHIGNSDGELQHTTLRSMQHDLAKVVEFVRQTWLETPLVVIASDLGARAALKTAGQVRQPDLLLLVNPTLDIQAMLTNAHGHDLVADYHFGLRRGIANVFGLNINADMFVGDLIAGNYTDLNSSVDDLRSVGNPIAIVTSPQTIGSSLPPPNLPHAFVSALSSQARMKNIPTSLTDNSLTSFEPHPAAFQQVLTEIAAGLSMSPSLPYGNESIRQDVARQCRIERECAYLKHGGSQMGREALSSAQLSHAPQLGNLHQYRKSLDDVYASLAPLNPGDITTDLGAGESDLIRAIMLNHLYRAGRADWSEKAAPIVVGVRQSLDTIIRANRTVQSLRHELSAGLAARMMTAPPLAITWIHADWTESLPFRENCLHRMISNLSLPYVRSPLTTLREWQRVLHPEGRLVLTTFHPNTDLSPLYRTHLRQANQDEFSMEAQPLLHYVGRLREAIRRRMIHTFDRKELASLMTQAGFVIFDILPAFDAQTLIAIAGKRISSSPNH